MVPETRKSDSSVSSQHSSHHSASEHDDDMEMAPLTPAKETDDDKDVGMESTEDAVGGTAGLLIKLRRNGQVLYACSFYSFCSVSMVLVNKSLASRCVIRFLSSLCRPVGSVCPTQKCV
jgi:hypothetical protein